MSAGIVFPDIRLRAAPMVPFLTKLLDSGLGLLKPSIRWIRRGRYRGFLIVQMRVGPQLKNQAREVTVVYRLGDHGMVSWVRLHSHTKASSHT